MKLFGYIRVEHHFSLICPFWNSLPAFFNFFNSKINIIYNWKNILLNCQKDHLHTSKIVIDFKKNLAARHFPMGIRALSKSLWYLWQLWKSFSKLSQTCQIFMPSPIKSFWHIQKCKACFETHRYLEIHVSYALLTKLDWYIRHSI